MPTSKRTTRRLLLFWATCNIVFVVALYYHPVVVQYFVETPEDSLSQSAQLPVEPVQALFKTAAIMSAKTEPTQIEAMQIKPPEPISRPPGEPINCLYLHIPKTGGTSFTKQLIGMERDSPRVNRHRMFTYTSIRYQKHFDWSVVDHMKAKHDYQVVTLLRNPVDRAISHFHFIKSQPWVSREFLKMNLEQFVRDPQALMDYRGVWQDGQAGVSFLTGTHVGRSWVAPIKGHHPSDEPKIIAEERSLDELGNVRLAAERLGSTLWFGLNERLPESMKLLSSVIEFNFADMMT